MDDKPLTDSTYVMPSQLSVGMHIHLDLPWTAHPFTFSSFKIKNGEQIGTLKSLGLTRIRYSPAKSEGQPLPATLDAPPEATPAKSLEDDPTYQAKRARIER